MVYNSSTVFIFLFSYDYDGIVESQYFAANIQLTLTADFLRVN